MVQESSAPAEPPPAFEAGIDPRLNELQEAVYQYAQDRKQKPRSLDEVIAARYLPAMPVAPKGKKFVMNTENLEVKLVAQ